VIIAVVAVAVAVVVVYVAGSGGGSGTAASPAATSPQAVAADTSGSYGELVQRANDLYDQGAAKLQAKQYAQGAEYFLAASRVYAAAWKQQATDPAVGTDFATALFYSGKVAAALEQVDVVLAQSPEFQTAWFNKGNYLAEKASQADKAGNAKSAKAAYAGARVAYQKAIDLDPSSSSGQQAQQQLSGLPTPSP
jgi:tetratricopeptide (TPR) repeat protein